MEKKTINFINKLIEKSTEAFIMGLEIYNKPTIKYRVEGFSFFICNAWELMLKAKLLKEGKSIYFSNQPNRTISLTRAIELIFTNNKNPLRINLETINELRNTSTHFITQEYEMVFIPLFQACIFNFNEKIKEFHSIDMTKFIPQNFLTLSVSMKSLNKSEFKAKYPEELSNKIFSLKKEIDSMETNPSFAISITHYHYLTKDKNKADSFIAIDQKAENNVKIIKEVKNVNNTHPYTLKTALEKINNSLSEKLTTYHFLLFVNYYNLKYQERFCFKLENDSQPRYYYSQQTIDFIVAEYSKDPKNIIENLKKKVKEIKKD